MKCNEGDDVERNAPCLNVEPKTTGLINDYFAGYTFTTLLLSYVLKL